jgi:hypothetical protein
VETGDEAGVEMGPAAAESEAAAAVADAPIAVAGTLPAPVLTARSSASRSASLT